MYPNGAGYQQPYHPPTTSHAGPFRSGPPPAKMPRSSLVITRYPPPPGYRGPAQPQTPFSAGGWQQSPASFEYRHQIPPSFQQPQYAPQQAYPGYQAQQFPPTPASYYPSPAQSWPGAQNGWQTPIMGPQSASPISWQHPPEMVSHDVQRHNSAPFPTTGEDWTGPLDGNGDAMSVHSANDFPTGTTEDLETEFDGECYFSRHPEEINPELSLGLIEWKAPKATTRALPSTFKEAELDDIAPRPPRPSDAESVSEYFIYAKREEAFLSVRQTDVWHEVKDSLIFREFAAFCQQVIPKDTLIKEYRCRFDQAWFEAGRSPTPSRESSPAHVNDWDGAVNRPADDDREADATGGSEQQDGGVLDDLEQALFSSERTEAGRPGSMPHGRNGSVVSQDGANTRSRLPSQPARNQNQEDVLASLGVTGSPKLVYHTPGPAFGPPPSLSRNSSAGHPHGAFPVPPPPPEQPPHAQARQNSTSSLNGYTQHRPTSAGSSHTAAGSDFDGADEATPRPVKLEESRKRSYNDAERQDDDTTPRRKQPRVENSYGRRW